MAEQQSTVSILLQPDLRNINGALRSIEGKSIKLNLDSQGFSQPLGQIKGSLSEFDKSMAASNARVLAFGASAGVIYGVSKAFKEMVTASIDVEKGLAEININLGLTQKNLQGFGGQIFNIARETSKSFDETAKASAEFARQGLGAAETLKRTKDALVLSRLANLDSVTATEDLTAAINSFNQSALSSTEIVSKFARVDANFAVSSKDLAEAIKRVGSTSQQAGVDIDNLIGLVTAAQQTTSRGGAVIGNALKTIFTRLESSSTIEQLRALGVEIDSTQNGLQKLQAVAQRVKSVSPLDAAAIRELTAGKLQINILNSILPDLANNYGIVARAALDSSSATDEANQKNEALNKTLSATVQSIKTSLTQLGSSVGGTAVGGLFGTIEKELRGIAGGNKLEGEGESAGETFAKGLAQGVSNFLTGPGAVLITGILSTITFNFARSALGSLDSILGQLKTTIGLGDAKKEQLVVETQIANILSREEGLLQRIQEGTAGIVSVQNTLLAGIEREILLRETAARFAATGLSTIKNAGYTIEEKPGASPTFVRVKTRAAVGLIPEAEERIGALKGGYTPGAVKEMTIPNYGRVIYNTAEKVRQFPGLAQPAIMPPQASKAGVNYKKEFQSAHGFDPYKARGLVPNFVDIEKIVAYHVSKVSSPTFDPSYKTELSSMGYHFGTEEQAKFRSIQYDFRSKSPTLGRYKLSIKNPLDVSHMASFAPDHLAEKMMDLGLLDEDKYGKIRDRFFEEPKVGNELVKILKKSGYDGLRYANEREGEGFSYVPFDKNQIEKFFSGFTPYKAEGQIPNFAPKKLGSGFYGTFYDLERRIGGKEAGLKRFARLALPESIENEYRMARALEGLGEVDPLFQYSIFGLRDVLSPFQERLASKLLDEGIRADDFVGHEGNTLLNSRAQDIFLKISQQSDKVRDLFYSRLEDNPELTDQVSRALAKKGARLGVIDPGLFRKETWYKGQNQGLIPSFANRFYRGVTSSRYSPFSFTGTPERLFASNDKSIAKEYTREREDFDSSYLGSLGKFSIKKGTKFLNTIGEKSKERFIKEFVIPSLNEDGPYKANYSILDIASTKDELRQYKVFNALENPSVLNRIKKAGYQGVSLDEYDRDYGDEKIGKSIVLLDRDAIENKKQLLKFNRGLIPSFNKESSIPNFAEPGVYGHWISPSGKLNPIAIGKSSHEKEALRLLKVELKRGNITQEKYDSLNIPLNSTSAVEDILFDLGYLRGVYSGTNQYYTNGRRVGQSLTNQQKRELRNYGIENKANVSHLPTEYSSFEDALSIHSLDNSYSRGLIPSFSSRNFAEIPSFSSSALQSAISREHEAGIALSQIQVGADSRLKGPLNPVGLGVFNKIDEPSGLQQGISRALSEGRNPKTYNVPNAAEGRIPNFANPVSLPNPINQPLFDAVVEGARKDILKASDKAKTLEKNIKDLSDIYGLSIEDAKKLEKSFKQSIANQERVNKSVSETDRIIQESNKGKRKVYGLEQQQTSNVGFGTPPTPLRTQAQIVTQPVGPPPSFLESQRESELERQRVASQVAQAEASAQFEARVAQRRARDARAASEAEVAAEKAKMEAEQLASKRAQRLQNFGLVASIAGPLVGGIASSFIGDETRNARGGSAIANTAGNALGFAGLGASIGGPVGAGIGALVGVLAGLPDIIKGFTDVLPDLQKNIEKTTERLNKNRDSFQKFLEVTQKLSDESLLPETRDRLKKEQVELFSSLPPNAQRLIPQSKTLSGTIEKFKESEAADEIDRRIETQKANLIKFLQNERNFKIEDSDFIPTPDGGIAATSRSAKLTKEGEKSFFSSVLSSTLGAVNPQTKKSLLELLAGDSPYGNVGNQLDVRQINAGARATKIDDLSPKDLLNKVSETATFTGIEGVKDLIDEILKRPETEVKAIADKFKAAITDVKSGKTIGANLDFINDLVAGRKKDSQINEAVNKIFSDNYEVAQRDFENYIQKLAELKDSESTLEVKRATDAGELERNRVFATPEKQLTEESRRKNTLIDESLKNVLKGNRTKAEQDLNNQVNQIVEAFQKASLREADSKDITSEGREKILNKAQETAGGLRQLFKSGAIGLKDTVTVAETRRNALLAEQELPAEKRGVGRSIDQIKLEINTYQQLIDALQKLSNAYTETDLVATKSAETAKKLNEEEDKQKRLLIRQERTLQIGGSLEDKFNINSPRDIFTKNFLSQNSTSPISRASNALSIAEYFKSVQLDIPAETRKALEETAFKKIRQLNPDVGEEEARKTARNQVLSRFSEGSPFGTGRLSSLPDQQEILKIGQDIIKDKNIEAAKEAEINKLIAERLYTLGEISAEQLQQINNADRLAKINAGTASFKDVFAGFGDSLKYNTKDFLKDVNDGAVEVGNTLKTSFAGAIKSFASGSKTAFQDFGIAVAQKIFDKTIDINTNLLFNALGQGASSLFGGGKAQGGLIKGYASGGRVMGGSGVRDDIPALLNDGEFVIKKSSVNKYGPEFFDKLNMGGIPHRYAEGGSAQIRLQNEFLLDNNKQPTRGERKISPLLSNFALSNEDDLATQRRIKTEDDLEKYLKNKADVLAAYKRAKRQRITGALISAGIGIASAGITAGIQSYQQGLAASAATKLGNGVTDIGGSGPNVISNREWSAFTSQYRLGNVNAYTGAFNAPSSIFRLGGSRGFRGEADGGFIKYNMGGRADTVPALLMGGEYVLNKDTVSRVGVNYLERLNGGRIEKGYAGGGYVGGNAAPAGLSSADNSQKMVDGIYQLIDLLGAKNDKKSGQNTQTSEGQAITNNFTFATTITIDKNGNAKADTQTTSNDGKSDESENEKGKRMGDAINSIFYTLVNKELRPNGLILEAIKRG